MGFFEAGWSAPGIGYWYLVFPSGTVYQVGSLEVQRASVSGENDHIIGVALVGDFTEITPTDAALEAIHALRVAVVEPLLGRILPVQPHRFHTQTSCPGNTYLSWIGRV